MPYIKPENRTALDYYFGASDPELNSPLDCGELNYAISRLIHNYLSEEQLRYCRINEVIGVLECAKLELYRQLAAPYEDIKKAENGSVSELDKE